MSCDAGDGTASDDGEVAAAAAAVGDGLCVGSSPAPASDDACEVDVAGEGPALEALAHRCGSTSDGWTKTKG